MNSKLSLGIIGGVAAFAGLSYLNFRRAFPAAKTLSDQKEAIRIEKLPVSYDGKTIYGEFLSPKGLTGKRPTVICAHGFGASYRTTEIMIGRALAMSGWNAYCFDFCGGSPKSKSSGTMKDMSVFTEKQDLLHVIDYMKTLPEVDTEHLFLLGESQGGFVSAISAPERNDDIRAMVLYYPAFCIPDDARKRFPDKADIPDETRIMGKLIGGEYSRAVYDFDVYRAIGGYTGPVLILHGDSDQIVPVEYGKRAAETYKNAEFIPLPGEIHGWTGKGKRTAAEKSFQFFSKYL